MSMKIYFAGLYDDDNLGDPVIAKCAETLFLRNLQKGTYEVGYVSLNHFCFHPASTLTMKFIGISSHIPFSISKIIDYLILKDYESYFDEVLKDADAVIVVGGGLIEFTGGRFADGLFSIARVCTKKDIPFIITATGIEGYDSSNNRCLELKRMLHMPSLKYISTRDDLETLVDKYFDGNNKVPCEKVADTAVWASEVFNIKKDTGSNIIGIGVIRDNIFKQYGTSFGSIKVRDLYCDIVRELKKDDCDVILFTNGTKADNDTALLLQSQLGSEGINVSLEIPKTSTELVTLISGFKGVIAGRLHSCIISYSLDIPAIGLVWNRKLALFGAQAGCPENFVDIRDFDSSKIVKRLKVAINVGYDQSHRDKFRQTILDSIDYCVDNFIRPLC